MPLYADNSILEGHWYGSRIFFRCLSEHVGGQNTIKTIWGNSITHDSKLGDFSFEAVSEAIISQGTTFPKVFSDFTVANLLKTFAPYKYEEGEFYTDIGIDKIVIENSIYNNFLSGLSSRCYEISHIQEAVDRYIKQYEQIKKLIRKGMDEISMKEITGRSMKVVKEYIKLYYDLHPDEVNKVEKS